MASIIQNRKTGTRAIQFTAKDGRRPKIGLGKVSKRIAESVKVHVERLVASSITGHAAEDDTSRWLTKLDSVMLGKLVNAGLIARRESATLREFVSRYIESRRDVKPATRKAWNQALDHLTGHFGDMRSLKSLTAGDAGAWRQTLVNTDLADATVRKYTGYVKQFFDVAVDHELITKNPFRKLPSAPVANKSRQRFISPVEIDSVIEKAPDAEWRLIIALSRYGGLRCPSEHLALRWADIDWERGRIHVRSPKTERHVGHESRDVPLFPELKPYLLEASEVARTGAVYVIESMRDKTDSAFRRGLKRIIERTGMTPWPRITHNLRSSRQTELCERFPAHVVSAWLGNSTEVADKHYLQVTDDHFQQATEARVQKRVQQPAALARRVQSGATRKAKKTLFQGVEAKETGVDGNRTHLATFQPPHWV